MGFYSVHNPERISSLDAILKQYAGKEDVLVERLEQKYSADLSHARWAVRAPPHQHLGTDAARLGQAGAETGEENAGGRGGIRRRRDGRCGVVAWGRPRRRR